MKRIKKSKLIISIILLSLLIIEIITIGLSRASKTIDITLTAIDSSSALGNKEMTIEASKTDDGNYSLTFPESINGFNVKQYSLTREYTSYETDDEAIAQDMEAANISINDIDANVTAREIIEKDEEDEEDEEETTTNTEEGNNQQDENESSNSVTEKSEAQLTYENIIVSHTTEVTNTQSEVYLPGSTITLTKAERKTGKISTTVTYETKQRNDNTLYKQSFKANTAFDKKASTVEVTAYAPLNSKMVLKTFSEDEKNNISTSLLDAQPDDKYSFYDVYSPIILYSTDTNELDMSAVNDSNLQEFDTASAGEELTISLTNLNNTGAYVLYSVKETDEDYSFVEIAKEEQSNRVSYSNTTLGKYALLYNPSFDLSATASASLLEENVLKAASTDSTNYKWDGSVSTNFIPLDPSGTAGAFGSMNNPYLISSGADLAYLAQRVNSGNTYAGSYFRLVANIDLDGREWTPIGNGTNSFQGIFDGQGHNITNGNINNNTNPGNNNYIYLGLFGSVGNANTASVVKNVEIKQFTINLTREGDLDGGRGYYIGTLVGGLFRNATAENCAIVNSNINIGDKDSGDQGGLVLTSATARVMVGGAIGATQTGHRTYNDSGNNSKPQVKAIYSDVDIVADNVTVQYDERNNYGWFYTQNNYRHYYSQNFAVGGVIGATIGERTSPEYCSYTGNVKTNEGFTGPIMGGAYSANNANNAASTNNYRNNFEEIFSLSYLRNGTDVTFNNYYYNYSITSHTVTVRTGYYNYNNATNTNRTFTQTIGTITGATVPTNNNYRFEAYNNANPSTNDSYSKYWNGINAGIKVNSTSDIYQQLRDNVFEQGGVPSTYYAAWENTGSSLNLLVNFAVNIETGTATDSYLAVPDPYSQALAYNYYWYINGEIQNVAPTNATITNVSHSWTEEKTLMVICKNQDGNIAIDTETIAKYELHIVFNVSGGIINTSIQGTGRQDPNFNISDYDYQWYYVDIAEGSEEMPGETNSSLTNLTSGYEYEIRATNREYDYMNVSGSIIYGNRDVVYVNYGTYYIDGNYYSGNDLNDGRTPQTAVETLPAAYRIINSSYKVNENIIVIMGNYNARDVFYNTKDSTNANYQKNATLTGKYRGTEYNGRLYMYYTNGYGSTYNFVNGDTTFQNLTFYGNGSQAYLYAQGHDLVMGKALTMSNYAQSATNQGLITRNAPAFHVLGGYLQFNRTTLPRNNGSVTIKSGAYARVLGGGGSGTSAGVGQGTSHDFTGTDTQHYVTTINIDIETSTRGTYDFDINLVVGGATAGNTYADTTINLIKGDVGRLLGGSIGDTVTRPNNMRNYPMNDYIGSTTMNLTGGNLRELYGGSLGRNMTWMGGTTTGDGALLCDIYHYGNININLAGTNIGSNQTPGTIYGAGAGGVTGYSTNSSDNFKSFGQNYPTTLTMNISDGTINADVYGGGYGHTEYLYNGNQRYDKTQADGGALYGNSIINISGGTINGDIYGAGRGYDNGTANGNDRSPNLARMEGKATINISGSPIINGDIYGAGMGIANRSEVAKLTGSTEVNIEANISNHDIYGGGRISYVQAATNGAEVTNVNLKSGTLSGNVYGGCNSANIVNGSTNVTLQGATSSGSIFGGCNQTGTVPTTNVTLTSGEAFKVYGGNNAGGTAQITNVIVNGAKITDDENDDNDGAIFGAGKGTNAITNKANVTINTNANTIPNVYGGGEAAGVTAANNISGSGQTYVIVNGTKINNLFGGSYDSNQKTIDISNVTINNGTINNIYGANNQSGITSETKININNGTITNIFGGGNEANSNKTNITTNGGTITNIYGGGNKASIVTKAGMNDSGNTYVNLLKGTITNAYGGSNAQGDVVTTNLTVGANNSANNGLSVTNVYGGNNEGGTSTTTNVKTYQTTIQNVYGGSKGLSEYEENQEHAFAGTTNVQITGTHITGNVFGGGELAETTNATNITISNNATIDTNVYGGGNQATVGNAGHNATTHLSITNSTIKGNAFAAGNGESAITYGTTYAEILTGATIGQNYDENLSTGCVYGGGNQAKVVGNTQVLFNGGTVKTHVFGGGNAGVVQGSTIVNAKAGTTEGSIYGGGNLATVENNTLVNIYGNIKVGNSSTVAPKQGSVFGGGNKAETGLEANGGSKNIVNIAGGEIFGNAYGGANTSKVWGSTVVNIGLKAIQDYKTANPTAYDIPQDMAATALTVHGTVFGGGEKNESGSELYDWSYISATEGIDVNIDGQGYETLGIKFEKSVFGSGNASSSSGTSTIDIYNLGTYQSPNKCISIQRTDILTIKNSSLALEGINDSTNDHANELYTLNYIEDLKLANSSTLYLKNTSNCLTKWESLLIDNSGNETPAAINIDQNGNGTPNVRNNLYMIEGKQLQIKPPKDNTEEQYGKVIGMTFLGIFGNIDTPYESIGAYYKDTATNGQNTTYQAFNFTSVVGKHMRRTSNDPEEFLLADGEHDITKAGFYSNKYIQEGLTDEELDDKINQNLIDEGAPGKLKTYYVGTQPPGAVYYIWNVGNVDMTTYDVNIEASKYDTLGTKELSLTGFAVANTYYEYGGCRFALDNGITIKNKNQIPKIANPKADADVNFGLAMKTGAYGWVRSGEIEFEGSGTNGNMIEGGDLDFKTENSAEGTEDVTPDLELYFYHSQNIQTSDEEIGNVKIYLNVSEPMLDSEALNFRKICINITLSRKVYEDEFVEQSIQPGKKYDIFTSTKTQIVSDGVFSTYDTIYIDKVSTKERSEQYKHSRRVLVSTDFDGEPYYFNAGTKITMLDLVSNQTYYYIVTPEDAAGNNRTYKYYFSKFKKMGSMDEFYDENDALNNHYYNSTTDELYERYIFHYDFAEANVGQNVLNRLVTLQLEATVDNEDRTIIELIGSQREDVLYSLYTNSDAVIDVTGQISTNPLYLGKNNENLTVETLLTQSVSLDGKRIYDTNFFDEQMGIKISLVDSNGIQQDSDAMLGIYFTVQGDTNDSGELNKYYPRLDGSTRIKIGTKVANSIANLVMHTEENQSLATGDYRIRIETYGSSDGYYYGDRSSRSTEIPITIISGIFGLKVTSPVNQKIFKSTTGLNVDKNNQLDLQVQYSSLLDNPVLTVSCERRDYGSIYSKSYEAVDLGQIVSEGPTEKFDETTFTSNYMYKVAGKNDLGGAATKTYNYKMKTKVPTGTYKIVYSIYDGNTYIGSAYEYFIVN